MEEFKKKLEEAKKLIDGGKITEADNIFSGMVASEENLSPKEKSTLNLEVGLYFYKLGKEEIKKPTYCGERAEYYLSKVLDLEVSISDVTKALEILPLACQDLLKDNQKAVAFAEVATDRASSEDKPQALNKQGRIERKAGLFKSLETFSKAQNVAREKGNFKEEGDAYSNEAEILITISETIDFAKEAFIDAAGSLFFRALSSYGEHEEMTGESLEILKNNVEERIQGLSVLNQ